MAVGPSIPKSKLSRNDNCLAEDLATEGHAKDDNDGQNSVNATDNESDCKATLGLVAAMSPQDVDWHYWNLQIRNKIEEEVGNWDKVFLTFNTAFPKDEPEFYYYVYNGDLFVIRDNGTPWRGLSFSELYGYAVHIKEFIDPGLQDLSVRWSREGSRVVEVPDVAGEATEVAQINGEGTVGTAANHAPKRRRITGIVLERLGRSMADYDPDNAAFCGFDTAVFLERLGHVVSFLHSVGLAHNDLKPVNVMLRDNDLPVLVDFESCAVPGTVLHLHGSPDWRESEADANITRFENNMFAMRMFREPSATRRR